MSSIELSNGSATLTARAEYLLVVEHGTLTTAVEVGRYTAELETAASRFQLRRLLVDARSETSDAVGQGDARAAMWAWIRGQRAFEMIGFVLVDEMMIARVNMTALSERLSLRAFDSVAEGHRWLARRGRGSTATAIPVATREPAPSTPTGGTARDSATRQLRPRVGTRTEEGDAFAGPGTTGEHSPVAPARTMAPARTIEPARTTVKIAAIDPGTADQKLGRR